jgi:hypothetical protein
MLISLLRRERELLTIRLIDHLEKTVTEEGVFLPPKCKQVLNTLRGHVEDSLTSLTGDALTAFSKSGASSIMEYTHDGEEKYDDLVGEDFYNEALDAYNRGVAQGFSAPLWNAPNPLSKKRKAISAAAPVRAPLGFAPPPKGKGKGGKGKGGKGKGGKGKGGKGKGRGKGNRGQRGRGKGVWRSRS